MTSKTDADHPAAKELGDETFMSADDLRAYMTQVAVARASKDVDAMNARTTLGTTWSKPCPSRWSSLPTSCAR